MDLPLVACEASPRDADALLPFEHRWRIQLTMWQLCKELLHVRFPRLYGALQAVHRTVRRPPEAISR